MVIVTHSDHDHFGGLGAIKNANPAVALTCGDQDRFMVEDPETTYSFRYNHYAADHGIAFDDDARAAIRAAIMEDLGNAQQIDFTWSGGETLRIGPDWLLEIHHVPGHTYGHLCVFDTKNRAIFGGDGVQGSVYPSVEGGAALGPTYLYVDSYLTTIRYLIDISKTSAPTCSAWLTGPFSMAAKLIVFSTRAAPTSSKWIGRCSKLSHERQTAHHARPHSGARSQVGRLAARGGRASRILIRWPPRTVRKSRFGQARLDRPSRSLFLEQLGQRCGIRRRRV